MRFFVFETFRASDLEREKNQLTSQGRERGRLEGAIDWAADDTLRAITALVG